MIRELLFAAFLFGAACALAAVPGYVVQWSWAGDFNDRDTALVEIWTRHDLGYEPDTVRAVVSWRCGAQWYVRTADGEYWSDRQPKKIKEK